MTCYFHAVKKLDSFIVVPKEHWDTTKSWDDSGYRPADLPKDFLMAQESVYEYQDDFEQGRQMLLDIGYIETVLYEDEE